MHTRPCRAVKVPLSCLREAGRQALFASSQHIVPYMVASDCVQPQTWVPHQAAQAMLQDKGPASLIYVSSLLEVSASCHVCYLLTHVGLTKWVFLLLEQMATLTAIEWGLLL